MSSRPSGGLPRKILLLALAYFAAASLARLLAIPPGYAAVVWPSAGVAVAALWLWGVALWPGVLLGSFAANVWNPAGTSSNAPLAAWIAVGAAVQAAAAVLAARRVLSGRDPLRGDGDRIRFLLIAGPLAGLIAATWAVIGMRVLGAISAPETAFAWATWWVGDAIGVALAAPLVLLWFGPRRGPRRGRAIVSATLALTMAAVAAVHLYAVRNEEDILRSHTRRKVADVSLTLRVGLAGHLDSLQTAADIFASGKHPTRAEFKNFAGGILARHPGMQALEWRPRVSASQRAAVEAAARRDGLNGFSFTGIGPGGALVPRGPAAVYFPIYYVEPLRGNEKALGLDIGQQQNPVHDAAERALTTGQASASGGVRLIQETGEQRGVVVMVPVSSMRDGGPIGLIEGVYRVGDMMESLLAGVDRRTLGMRLYDDTSPNAPELLYSRGAPPEGSSPPITMTGDFAGRRWRVELIPLRGFQSRDRSVLSWFVVAASFLFSYLVCWTTLTLFGRAETIAALVEQKTEELREQERRLMQAQKLESVGLLAGGIAHEFNNILMGASGLAQIVRAGVGPAHPSAPDLDEIVATIKRASHLVTQLLTYSRRKDPQERPTDLNAVIANLSKMLAIAAGGRVKLLVEAGPGPAWIMADPGQVEQVLLNLCFNARDAVKGKGRITVSARPVRLEKSLDTRFLSAGPGRFIVLEVTDDGPGIPGDVLPRLFEPFFTTKRFGEGSGLGLSVVSGIVRRHGGGLDIRTSADEGTAMSVYWQACDPPRPERTPPSPATAPRGQGLILVVDDEPMMRPLLSRILSDYGYECVAAAGGAEALEILARTPAIRGVVLDLVMPEMDGLETYDRMIRLRPGLKALILSGYAPGNAEAEIARLGLPYLTKPADAAALALALSQTLGSSPPA